MPNRPDKRKRVSFYQVSSDVVWEANDTVRLSGLIGYSRSVMTGREDKFYSELIGDVILDYEGANRFSPDHQFGVGTDLLDSTIWRAHENDLNDVDRDYSFFNGAD